MDKDKFLFLLSNSASLTEEETKELIQVRDEFPYSQAIHTLVARGAQLNQLPDQQALLTKAAVYATDRALLKAIVMALPGARKIQLETKEELVDVPQKTELKQEQPSTSAREGTPPKKIASVESEVKKETVKPTAAPPEQPIQQAPKNIDPVPGFKGSKLEGDELIDELFHDLDKLKKLKHDFEVTIAQFDQTPVPKLKDSPPEVEKEKPIEKKRVKEKPEGIIAEIKSTKKKIKPSDPKQKEQLDIINQFIKSEPNIGKNKGPGFNPDTTDLSANNSSYTDNIVSETLVEILIKQGKKEKAVEMLKKLIWKFPQKKAYFAAQIEELTS